MWGFPLWVGWWWGLRWIIVVLGYPKNGMDALYMRLVQKFIVARFGRDHLEGFWSSAMIHGMQDTMMTGSQGRSTSFIISGTNIRPHQLPWFEASWSWSGVVVSARSDKGVLISKPTAFDFVPSFVSCARQQAWPCHQIRLLPPLQSLQAGRSLLVLVCRS